MNSTIPVSGHYGILAPAEFKVGSTDGRPCGIPEGALAGREGNFSWSDCGAKISLAPGPAFRVHPLEQRHDHASGGAQVLAQVTGGGLAVGLDEREHLCAGVPIRVREDDHFVGEFGGRTAADEEGEGPAGR